MACDTKERIIEEALRLFSEKGYAGTSMSDIAERLKITKAALYKHYSGKREIFQKILDRMSALDAERAAEYDMPGAEDDEYAEAYMKTALDSIRRYSNDPTMADLYQNYLAAGPAEYMARIFRRVASTDAEAMQLALEFYGPMFLLYSMYDGAKTDDERKSTVLALDEHIVRFAERLNTKHQTKVGP